MTGRQRVFLGIDCGTQSTKAMLVDAESLEVVRVGRAPHELIERPDGTREQHPDWWVEATKAAVRSALQGPAVEVAGIAVSGQHHGLVTLDDARRPNRPAKLWNDTTTGPDCAELTRKLGGLQRVIDLTGNSFLTGYTAPKIHWLKRNEPEAYRQTKYMCLPHDYLNLWLTGMFVSEPGEASGTAYFDVRGRCYSEPVLQALDDCRNWKEALPEIVPSLSLIGTLRKEAAEALGLADGVPVTAGGGDSGCSAIGAGAVRPGPVVVSLGTSGVAFSYSPVPAVDPMGEAAALCDSTDGWLPLVCTINVTVSTEWVRRLFGLSHEQLDAAIVSASPGASGLAFLPYLGGERTPDCPDSSGVLSGVGDTHTPMDFVRAVVEGVTFGLDYALGALRRAGVTISEISLVGGGAASNAWAQLCADIFSVPVSRPVVADVAPLGAAIQARHVIDHAAFVPVDEGGGHWEPHSYPELLAAARRNAELRRLAVERRI